MHSKHVKGLIWALAASGFVNIILLTSIFYMMNKEHSPALYCEQKPIHKVAKQTSSITDEELAAHLARLQPLSYEELLNRVKNNEPLGNGTGEGALAVSALVAFHHFDLSRALEGSSYYPQERIIHLSIPANPPTAIKIFQGLNEYHLSAITSFAESERWPQTPRGLYAMIQHRKGNVDASLLDAFYLTIEFMTIEPIFRRLDPALERKEIVNLLIEGDWQMVSNLSEHQRKYGDLSRERRQTILFEYAQKGSVTASALLQKLSGAAKIEKTVTKNKKPDNKPLAEASSFKIQKTPPVAKSDRLYIIQEGDNLWKLSKRFNIEIEVLRRYNKLPSDALVPGSAIRIPAK